MSKQEHTCEMCGRDFESYPVFIPDDFTEIFEWQKRKTRFEHLCEWCNHMYFQEDRSGKKELAVKYSDVDVAEPQDNPLSNDLAAPISLFLGSLSYLANQKDNVMRNYRYPK